MAEKRNNVYIEIDADRFALGEDTVREDIRTILDANISNITSWRVGGQWNGVIRGHPRNSSEGRNIGGAYESWKLNTIQNMNVPLDIVPNEYICMSGNHYKQGDTPNVQWVAKFNRAIAQHPNNYLISIDYCEKC